MTNEVLKFNVLLCNKMEPTWLRRNSTCYNLVSYVNNLTCLFIGKQYTDVALFIRRIDAELEWLESNFGYHYEYFEIAKSYMQKVVRHLFQNNLFSEIAISLLPEKYQKKEVKITTQDNHLDSDFQTLFDNNAGKEGAFIYYLHEEAVFNEQAFWDFYNSVISITKRNLRGEIIDDKTNIAVILTHKRIIEYFVWHLSENDAYRITNYPTDTIQLFMERLNYLIDGYLKGYIIEEDRFEEELKNPICSE